MWRVNTRDILQQFDSSTNISSLLGALFLVIFAPHVIPEVREVVGTLCLHYSLVSDKMSCKNTPGVKLFIQTCHYRSFHCCSSRRRHYSQDSWAPWLPPPSPRRRPAPSAASSTSPAPGSPGGSRRWRCWRWAGRRTPSCPPRPISSTGAWPQTWSQTPGSRIWWWNGSMRRGRSGDRWWWWYRPDNPTNPILVWDVVLSEHDVSLLLVELHANVPGVVAVHPVQLAGVGAVHTHEALEVRPLERKKFIHFLRIPFSYLGSGLSTVKYLLTGRYFPSSIVLAVLESLWPWLTPRPWKK